jgi:hypothetical protein
MATCYINIYTDKDGTKEVTIEYYMKGGEIVKDCIQVDEGDEIEMVVR